MDKYPNKKVLKAVNDWIEEYETQHRRKYVHEALLRDIFYFRTLNNPETDLDDPTIDDVAVEAEQGGIPEELFDTDELYCFEHNQAMKPPGPYIFIRIWAKTKADAQDKWDAFRSTEMLNFKAV